jgi:carnitine O-acetyltransferase
MSLYAHQHKLPRLPIPELKDTATTYLESVKPHLSATEFQRTKNSVAEFIKPSGFGHVLQQRLLDRDQAVKDKSWLIDWWNDYAYMAYRDPVVINVNYFFGTIIYIDLSSIQRLPRHLSH